MRVLLDYRPALRQRSGVGEYVHQLAAALLTAFPPAPDAAGHAENRAPVRGWVEPKRRDQNGRPAPFELVLFSSSWKDRLELPNDALAGAVRIDRRVPVRLLNLGWHRLGWPPVEALTGRYVDVAHSLHPLILPSRNAAQVITIHDLNFLDHPERTRREIRRDYPTLAAEHARRADGIIAVSRFTAAEIERRFQVPPERITVCSPGAPDWNPRTAAPAGANAGSGYVLFFGTLEPRKNLGALLDAYERLLAHRTAATLPPLVVAGHTTAASQRWLERLACPPLDRIARHIGYVDPEGRRALYEGARMLVQPSFEEGFGIPVLEAMTLGVPVVAANRGALPEVLGDAGPLIDPEQPDQLAAAIARLLDDPAFEGACAARGPLRARRFRWDDTARRVYEAYQRAIARRRGAQGSCASG